MNMRHLSWEGSLIKNFLIQPRDRSLITGRGGATKWENSCPKLFVTPPQDRVKLFVPLALKGGNFVSPPHPTVWLKLQAPMLKLP